MIHQSFLTETRACRRSQSQFTKPPFPRPSQRCLLFILNLISLSAAIAASRKWSWKIISWLRLHRRAGGSKIYFPLFFRFSFTFDKWVNFMGNFRWSVLFLLQLAASESGPHLSIYGLLSWRAGKKQWKFIWWDVQFGLSAHSLLTERIYHSIIQLEGDYLTANGLFNEMKVVKRKLLDGAEGLFSSKKIYSFTFYLEPQKYVLRSTIS